MKLSLYYAGLPSHMTKNKCIFPAYLSQGSSQDSSAGEDRTLTYLPHTTQNQAQGHKPRRLLTLLQPAPGLRYTLISNNIILL